MSGCDRHKFRQHIEIVDWLLVPDIIVIIVSEYLKIMSVFQFNIRHNNRFLVRNSLRVCNAIVTAPPRILKNSRIVDLLITVDICPIQPNLTITTMLFNY